MRTTLDVGSVLFGRARRLILGWLLGHPDEEFFLRQLVRQTGLSPGSVQRELDTLVRAGLVVRKAQGRQVYFRADASSPVFSELRSLFVKTAGLADVLREALRPLAGRILIACVFGSAARHELRNDSDIDLLVIGEVSFAEVIDVLGDAERTLGREISPTVYSPAEFRKKLREEQHFVTSVLKTPLVLVTGSRDDLEPMGDGEQMVGGIRDVDAGDRKPPRRRRSEPRRQSRSRLER
jgi:predicted nucleotidyltransferase